MKNLFEVIALDKNLQIVGLLSPTNIQWNRKYYESGTFSIQLQANQYSANYKYIYTNQRPEVGEISQVNYQIKNGSQIIQISGFFLEEELNRRICFKKSTSSNLINEPAWTKQAGAAETVALAYFNAFKDVQYSFNSKNYTSTLGIDAQASQGRGKTSNHVRDGSYLGNKMHTILKPSKLSYRVNYDLNANTKTLEIYSGIDRSQNNTEGNNPIVFSTEYGNIKNPNLVWADTEYKNCYIVTGEFTNSSNVKQTIVVAGNEATEMDLSDRFLEVSSTINYEDYNNLNLYKEALLNEGHNEAQQKPIKISLDIDTALGSYVYMQDFDLGDVCSIELPEVGIAIDAVLSGCIEVIKAENWTLTMEFDI